MCIKYSVRNSGIGDYEAISELSNQLGYFTRPIDIQDRLRIILDNTMHCVYVAYTNEKVIGWIHGFYSMRIESDFFVEIGGLVVDENYRKIGIGKKLVEKIIEWANIRHCHSIRVRCNIKRKDSHLFYQNIGFNLSKKQLIFNKRNY